MNINLAAISGAKYEKIYSDTWYSPDCGIELFNGSIANICLQGVINNLHIETRIGIIQAAYKAINFRMSFVRIDGLNYAARFIFAGYLLESESMNDSCDCFYRRHIKVGNKRHIIESDYIKLHKNFTDRIFNKYMLLNELIIITDIGNIIGRFIFDERLYII